MSTIEERLKESYRPDFDDDAWVGELFADQLKTVKQETDWYSAVCTRCPFFVDGARTGNTVRKLIKCHADDPDAVAGEISKPSDKMPKSTDERQTFKWADVPLIQCMKAVTSECLADSFIVTAFVFSKLQQEKQAMEYMRERIMQDQGKGYANTDTARKRSRRIIKSRRR